MIRAVIQGMDFSKLLDRARSGDADALEEIYRRFAPSVRARARARLPRGLRRRYDTLDLTHSVFADVLRGIGDVDDRGERAFRHWLYVKTESKVKTKLRRALGARGGRREIPIDEVPEPEDDTRDGPLAGAAAREELARLRAALARVSPADRRILLLRSRERLHYSEIARRLRLPSADAARMRHARALLALEAAWKSARNSR